MNDQDSYIYCVWLTPLTPFFSMSSINRERYSGDFSFRFTKNSKSWNKKSNVSHVKSLVLGLTSTYERWAICVNDHHFCTCKFTVHVASSFSKCSAHNCTLHEYVLMLLRVWSADHCWRSAPGTSYTGLWDPVGSECMRWHSCLEPPSQAPLWQGSVLSPSNGHSSISQCIAVHHLPVQIAYTCRQGLESKASTHTHSLSTSRRNDFKLGDIQDWRLCEYNESS